VMMEIPRPETAAPPHVNLTLLIRFANQTATLALGTSVTDLEPALILLTPQLAFVEMESSTLVRIVMKGWLLTLIALMDPSEHSFESFWSAEVSSENLSIV